jgi:hypothetical protein
MPRSSSSRFHEKLPDLTVGPTFTTGQDPLSAPLAAIENLEAPRDGHPLSGGERQGVDNAAIDTDCPADVDRGLRPIARARLMGQSGSLRKTVAV